MHAPSAGWDRVLAWQEATGDPVFIWGKGSAMNEGVFFGKIRAAFTDWIGKTGGGEAVSVYHDGMGAEALGALDPSPCKVYGHHQWFPNWERHFEWQLRATGLVVPESPYAKACLREHFEWIPERFLVPVPPPRMPIPEKMEPPGAEKRARTGIWLQGKSWRRYGNRLRSFADRWSESSGQLEIICEGGRKPAWANRDEIVWSAGLPFELARYRMYTWDSVLLLDDYSLASPWFLQALSLDCFPLVPDGQSPAVKGAWDGEAAPRPYPWGDPKAAISLLEEWRRKRDVLFSNYTSWREELLTGYPLASAFRPLWEEALQSLTALRPPRLRKRKPLSRWFPLAWYERLQRMRTGL